jgi:hypothetical protein
MPDIVQETGNAEEFLNVIQRRGVCAYLLQAWIKIPPELTGHMQGSKGVLKPAVLRSRIYPASALQLINPPQSLHPR